MSQASDPGYDREMRQLLFRVCKTRQELHDWILVYLGIDLPDAIVDEESNCCPMDMAWEMYSKCQENDENFLRVLYYANRSGYKTLVASIVEVLAVLHLDRDVAHMAAIEAQSLKAQSYVKASFRRPYIRDYVETENQSMLRIVRYYNPETDRSITRSEYEDLAEEAKLGHQEVVRAFGQFEENDRYIKIIIATLRGANSDHVPLFCVTEQTQILEKQCSPKMANRARKVAVARGLFLRLQGKNGSGRRPAIETPAVVETPATHVELLTLDHATGQWEFAPVVRAQSSIQETVEVVTDSGRSMRCGLNHPVFTLGKGYCQASELRVGDRVVALGKGKTSGNNNLRVKTIKERSEGGLRPSTDDVWHQVVLGSLLGDAGVYKKPGNNAYVTENHAPEQGEYLAWKREILSERVRTAPTNPVSGYTDKKLVGFRTGNSPLLNPYEHVRTRLDCVDTLGPLGLAVWYMDDGCKINGVRFSTEGFTREQQDVLVALLWDKFQIEVHVADYERDGKIYYCLAGDVEAKRRLVEVCRPYIHPQMAYKFDVAGNTSHCKYCGREFWFYERNAKNVLDCGSAVCRMVAMETLLQETVVSVGDRKLEMVYDFTLAKNYNYVSNGFLSHNCIDEVDVVASPIAYQEAQNIPSGRDGKLPITMLFSTRKSANGLVQEEIDNAPRTGLQIRHWNLVDVTERCLPERHQPDKPKITLYRSKEEVRTVDEATYNAMSPKEQETYKPEEAFAGCGSCVLFTGCRGRLATHQTSDSPLLCSIPEAKQRVKQAPNMVAAQVYCWKPLSTGSIYARFDRKKHVKTPAEVYQMVFDKPYDADPEVCRRLTRAELTKHLKALDTEWYAGQDYGDTHMFATVGGCKWGRNFFVTVALAAAEVEPDQMVEYASPIRELDCVTYGDTAEPGTIRMFRRHGYRMRDWKKKPGSVHDGIAAVRAKLSPVGFTEPELYFVVDYDGDPTMDLLLDYIEAYAWKLDAAGRPTGEPDPKNDDLLDALRYVIMNVFPFRPNSNIRIAGTPDSEALGRPKVDSSGDDHLFNLILQDAGVDRDQLEGRSKVPYGIPMAANEPLPEAGPKTGKGKRRTIVWDI